MRFLGRFGIMGFLRGRAKQAAGTCEYWIGEAQRWIVELKCAVVKTKTRHSSCGLLLRRAYYTPSVAGVGATVTVIVRGERGLVERFLARSQRRAQRRASRTRRKKKSS